MTEATLYLLNARLLADHKEEALSRLSARRRAVAEHMVEEKDCLLQCAAGALLRYGLGVTDESVFSIGEFGKPSLPEGPEFNLSYAGAYAALLVGKDEAVGVDIEPALRPDVLPRKMLTGEEMAWLGEHTSGADYCLLWTRLESALKAVGCGLAIPRRDFSLLEEDGAWHWDSRTYEGHIVTCAAASPLTITLRVLTAEDVLQD